MGKRARSGLSKFSWLDVGVRPDLAPGQRLPTELSVGQAYQFHLLPCTWTKPVLSSLASGTDRETDLGSYFKQEKSSGAAD